MPNAETLLATFVLPALVLLAKMSLLLAVTALVVRGLARASASARHLAWTLGLAGTLALPVASGLVPAWTFSIPVASSPAPANSGTRGTHFLRADAWAGESFAIPGAGVAEIEAASPVAAAGNGPLGAQAPRPAILAALAAIVVVVAYAAGSLFTLVRFCAAALSAAALVRRGHPSAAQPTLDELAGRLGIRRRVRLVESGDVDVPMTFGARAPSLVVPEGFASWSDARQGDVLLHELAHVARRDWLVTCLARLALVPLWFHPLARHAERRLLAEAELAADDFVLAHGTRASSYAAHLLGLARALNHPQGSSAMTVSMLGGPFDQRIRALLDGARARGPVPARLRAALGAGAAAAVLLCSAVNVSAEPAQPSAWEHAAAAVRQALGRSEAHGGDSFARAMRHHEAGEYELAIEGFEKSIAEGSRVGTASYNIACGHARLGHEAEAIDWLEKSVEAGFDVGSYLYRDGDLASLRGNARFQRFREEHGDREEADGMRRLQAELLASGSKDAGEWAHVGRSLLAQGAYDDAADALRRATAIEPHRSNALYNLACAEALAGRSAKALEALARAVDAGYTDASHAEEDEDLASIRGEAAFARALADMRRLEPDGSGSFLSRVFCDRETSRKADAERYESYLKDHPKSGHAWFQLGYVSLTGTDPARALAAFHAARDLGFRPGTSAYNIACCHARLGATDAAFQWLDRAEADGFDVADRAGDDEDLDSLRGDPRFKFESRVRGRVHGFLRKLHAY